MAAKLNADSFVDLLHRSGLFKPEKLEQHLAEFEKQGANLDSPQSMAKALIDQGALTSWQADYLLKGKHGPFFLGPYRLLDLLGKGGMGAVYLAEHQMMRRRCAVKVLPSRLIRDDNSLLDRFYLEAQAVAALDHPNIVRAYDVNKDTKGRHETHYLVMEYVAGQDLQTMVERRGRGLEFVEAADYIQQSAKGLSHAHENGLIHRDIKPANLLADSKGVVKILDLGLARFFDDSSEQASLTNEYKETTLGTTDYLSPEQALNSHEVDTRTDIYSLGCTLYFLLTASPPFPEGTVAQRLLCHQVKSPTPISKFRANVPHDLVAIVDRMVAKQPSDRYQTAAEVAGVLISWLAQHANDDWKRSHPDAVNEGAAAAPASAKEPTWGVAAAYDDTELGFAPLDDDEPEESKPEKNQSENNQSEDKQPEDKGPEVNQPQDDPQTVSQDQGASETLASLGVAPLAPLSSPDVFADLPPDPSSSSNSDISSLNLSQPMASGIDSSGVFPVPAQIPGQAYSQPAAADPNRERKSWGILLPIIIGVGVAVPLMIVLIMAINPFGQKDQSRPDVASAPAQQKTAIVDRASSNPNQSPQATSPTGASPPNTSPRSQPIENPSRPEQRPPEGGQQLGNASLQPNERVRSERSGPPSQYNQQFLSGQRGGPPVGDVQPANPARLNQAPGRQIVSPNRANQQNRPFVPDRGQEAPANPPSANVDGGSKEQPAADPTPPVDKTKQFAQIKRVGFHLNTQVGDRNLNARIAVLARETVEEMKLQPTPEASEADSILQVSLTVEQKGAINVFLSGELVCKVNNTNVTVWKHKEQIGTVAPRYAKQRLPTSIFQQLGNNAKYKFFKQFTHDYWSAVKGE